MKYEELSANTVAFISCRRRLTKVSAGATKGEERKWEWGVQVRLSNVDTRRLKWHINFYLNPVSLPVSTFNNLTRSPPPLLPFSTQATPALVSLRLELMKATVGWELLIFNLFSGLSPLQGFLQTWVRKVSLSSP